MGKEKYIDSIIYANFGFIVGVVLLLQPIVYVTNAVHVLPEIYFRWLAAVAIIDATLSILTVIFFRLYQNKHPELKVPSANRGHVSIWVWVLVVYLAYQVLSITSMMFAGSMFR